jgi:fumarate reductase subunit D
MPQVQRSKDKRKHQFWTVFILTVIGLSIPKIIVLFGMEIPLSEIKFEIVQINYINDFKELIMATAVVVLIIRGYFCYKEQQNK